MIPTIRTACGILPEMTYNDSRNIECYRNIILYLLLKSTLVHYESMRFQLAVVKSNDSVCYTDRLVK